MFGDRLKELRKAKGMTQKELGDQLNLSDRVIGYYEANRHFPDGDVLIKIGDIFNVSIDYLLCRTNNPNEQTNNKNELRPDIKKFIETANNVPPEVIENLTKTLESINNNYKVVEKEINGENIKYIVDLNKKPNGLTEEEELRVQQLLKEYEKIEEEEKTKINKNEA